MAKLPRDHVMVAREMVGRAVSIRETAAHLGVDESTLRYHLARPAAAADGRADRASALDGWAARVAGVLASLGDARVTPDATARCPTRVVFARLQEEHHFGGSYQAVRRYLRRAYGVPPVQAVRRVELPPGVQAQHDWFDWPGVIAGRPCALHGLIGTLAFSRATFVWVSPTMTQVAWQTGHLALFARYGGVPLWVRHDNLATAVAAGAGPTAVFNRAFAAFAASCGFQLDACRAAAGSDKGKVERAVRTGRGAYYDLLRQPWGSLEALQAALDERAGAVQQRLRCPNTGTTVAEALVQERAALQPLPAVHEPFDCVVARRVSRDCLVSFEGRRYSVPFAWVGRLVEIRGTARHVVVYGDGTELARHPRHTPQRLVLEPAHYEGPSTAAVLAPPPLGVRARAQLAAQVAALPAPSTLTRPLATYLTLLEEVTR